MLSNNGLASAPSCSLDRLTMNIPIARNRSLTRSQFMDSDGFIKVPNSNESNKDTVRVKRLGMIMLFFIVITIKPTNSCDQTLFLSSVGKICTKENCQDIGTYSFTFDFQKVVCFRMNSGDLAKFKMDSPRKGNLYDMIYRTSEFEIDIENT